MRRVKRTSSYRLVAAGVFLAAALPWLAGCQPQNTGVTVFEGARLITGDGSAPIENSAFIVESNLFTQVGRRGQLQIPAGALRVDLAGKTVMPAMIDLHGHFGYQHLAEGRMSKAFYTRENLIEHLERLAYVGVGATVGIADLLDRSDLRGGRTNWGDVPLRMREEVVPGAALFRTAGTGMAWPGSGAQGDPSRADVMYPVTTVEEARAAVQDYVKMKPEFIKIWVDSRGGTKPTLTPPMYEAILSEAHKFNVPVAVHNVRLADAKRMMRAGMEGWMHEPVRGGDAVDDELIAIVKDRIARGDRPVIWMTPSMITAWMDTHGGTRPALLDDPLLRDLFTPAQIEQYWGGPLAKRTPEEAARAKRDFALMANNLMKLRAAGMLVVTGSDTGQNRYLMGFYNHMDLESMAASGMTPSEVIAAATRDAARIAKINAGTVATGKSADFIVLNANPLEKIGNTRQINKVYLRGQEVDRAALKAKWQAQINSQTSSR